MMEKLPIEIGLKINTALEKNEEWSHDNISPSVIVEYFESLGFEKDDMDSNGWDYDFWIYMHKGDEKITITGSGYYGNIEVNRETDI
jgi:hypothetical protein